VNATKRNIAKIAKIYYEGAFFRRLVPNFAKTNSARLQTVQLSLNVNIQITYLSFAFITSARANDKNQRDKGGSKV
jgi:hypothetical protein